MHVKSEMNVEDRLLSYEGAWGTCSIDLTLYSKALVHCSRVTDLISLDSDKILVRVVATARL